MKSMTRKQVLVTGGAGFLGSHLCDRLLRDRHDVLCVDNFFTGAKDNIIHLLENPHFEFLRHDVCFPLYVEVDEIYNLACPASPIHYQYDPVQTTKTSVLRPRYFRPPQAKCTGILKFTPSRKSTGVMSTRLDYGHATMKANVVPRRFFLITTVSTN